MLNMTQVANTGTIVATASAANAAIPAKAERVPAAVRRARQARAKPTPEQVRLRRRKLQGHVMQVLPPLLGVLIFLLACSASTPAASTATA